MLWRKVINLELKVGMYVRFKNNKNIQYIGKIVNINEYREPCFKYAVQVSWYDDYIFIGDDDIIGEPSFNMVDLIKVGDYVNGEKVTSAEPGDKNDTDRYLGFGDYDYYIHDNEDIKDVVTKEQFNEMKYVVERND